MSSESETSRSARRPWLLLVGALVVALVLLFGAIFPAESGYDPLGIGGLLGLNGLSQIQPLGAQENPYRVDRIELSLHPGEFVEYKYQLEAGAAMLFSWTATAPVVYDFHSEPEGAPGRFAESFEQGEADAGHGFYEAPFSGIHGWFWSNTTGSEVVVTLQASGFFPTAHQFRDRAAGSTETTPLDAVRFVADEQEAPPAAE